MAARPGLEPRLSGPEPLVLPLHHRAWLPRWDSNPDKQLGRLLCYHYTTPALRNGAEGPTVVAHPQPAGVRTPAEPVQQEPARAGMDGEGFEPP